MPMIAIFSRNAREAPGMAVISKSFDGARRRNSWLRLGDMALETLPAPGIGIAAQ
jgi:hypothetical protein